MIPTRLLRLCVAVSLLPALAGSIDADVPVTSGDARAGRSVFAEACSACHGRDGEGTIGPALAGNRNLDRADYLLALVLRGGDGMPAFHERLSEAEIVAVVDYISTAWGDEPTDVEGSRLRSQWWRGADDAGELYSRVCARCHGPDGGGNIGPALASNENLGDEQYVAGKILHGQGGMPAFEPLIGPEGVTLLASFVRSSFGNDFGPVDPGTVRGLLSLPSEQGQSELLVRVVPKDVRLAVIGPGRFVHLSSRVSELRLDGLEPGSYRLTASKEGYRTATAGVKISTLGDGSRVFLELQPLAGGEADQQADEEPGDHPGAPATIAPALETKAALADNEQEYMRSCAACHGPHGRGGVGPALAGNGNLGNVDLVLDRILHGFDRMPAFGQRLSDSQIAAMATHERVAWGNGFERVTADEVAARRRSPRLREAPDPVGPSGPPLYARHCAVCHGSLGKGGVGPALKSNEDLAYDGLVASRIVMGGGGMPPFSEVLSSEEIADVATFVRTSWGNDFGAMSVDSAQNYHGGASSLDP